MGMEPKDFDRLVAHLKKHWLNRDCPICGTDDWSANGPVDLLGMETPHSGLPNMYGIKSAPGEALPVVVLTCKRCFFTRQFAWKPIDEASGG